MSIDPITNQFTIDDLINKGLQNANKALKTLTKNQVSFISVISKVMHEPLVLNGEYSNEKVVSLTTEIIGDLHGKSYLVLSEKDAHFISAGSLEGFATDVKMHEAFLLEMDNIISASVVSKISHFLQTKMYGDVPMLSSFPSWKQFSEKIQADTANLQSYYCNISNLNCQTLPGRQSLFIWIFNQKILSKASEKNIFFPSTSTPLL